MGDSGYCVSIVGEDNSVEGVVEDERSRVLSMNRCVYKANLCIKA